MWQDMDTSIETKGGREFPNGETWVDLQGGEGASKPDGTGESTDSPLHADSIDPLKVLRRDSVDERNRGLELSKGSEQEPGPSGGGPRFKRTTKQVVLVALLVLAAGTIAPFLWNYIQSYESTDDAQIDGNIDSISSRINGTVIRVHVEDDDRVKKGELLVEIDPRDYEVAVEHAKAELELALAQVASAKQGYAAALAKVREDTAANYRAQRDAGRYSILFEKQVVPQEQYDQYIATARVDAATVDSDREAAGSTLKAIAAR
jgi:membrane fusion protein, multidrug efflux system